MRIENVNNVDIITLAHKGINSKFQQIKQPSPYMPITDLIESKRVEIVFDDLKEVDELINMLERFRGECSSCYLGNWRWITK